MLINNQKGLRFYPCGLCTVFVTAKKPFNRFNQITAGGVKARKMLARKSALVLKLNCGWLGKWQEFFFGKSEMSRCPATAIA